MYFIKKPRLADPALARTNADETGTGMSAKAFVPLETQQPNEKKPSLKPAQLLPARDTQAVTRPRGHS